MGRTEGLSFEGSLESNIYNKSDSSLRFHDDIQNLVRTALRQRDMLLKVNKSDFQKSGSENRDIRVDCDKNEYGVTLLRKNRWYIIFYVFWSDFILIEMLPWIIIVALNLLTWKRIRQFQKNRKRFMRTHSPVAGNDIFQQTKVLMGLVVTFVFCQCFTIVADVHELICVLGNSKNYITGCPSKIGFFNVNNFISWGHFMLSVNSSVNFIFYMVHIKEFREAFLKSFCCCIQFCAKKDKDQKSRLNHHQNEECVPMDCMNGIQQHRD